MRHPPLLLLDASYTHTLLDTVESLGFALRFLSKYKPDSVALFAVEQLLIVCAPAAFLAFNYIVYGRLISYIGAEHSIVNPQKIAKIFVISDISTFLMQVRISFLTGSAGAHGTHFL